MYKPARYSLFILLITGLLAGCMGGAPAPQDHYYRLLPEQQTDNAPKVSLPYTIIGVPPVVAHGLYAERPILYVEAQAPLALKQYHYHHWHDSPSRIIQKHLIDWLQRHTTQSSIVRLNRGERSDILLTSRLIRFERQLSNNGVEVLVEIEMLLQKKYQTLHKKTYQQTLGVSGDSIHDTVEAFGLALTKIYTEFLEDLRRL